MQVLHAPTEMAALIHEAAYFVVLVEAEILLKNIVVASAEVHAQIVRHTLESNDVTPKS